MVAGFAIGGGHVLHLCCDLTIAADNARFGQSGPRVGSFDGGYGIGLLARQIGEKRAKEVWFLCRQYDAATALSWGLVNAVVPLEELEEETVRWATEMLALSPLALRLLKAGAHAGIDGLAGVQQLAGDATLLYYMSEGGAGGPRRVRGEAAARLLEVPEAPVNVSVAGAPRTLGVGVVPVLVGAASAETFVAWRFVAALLVALGLQVGVNYANDYFDGVRGVDRPDRLGPPRLVAGGTASPTVVLVAALGSIFVAGVAGLALALATEPALILFVGALASWRRSRYQRGTSSANERDWPSAR